MRTTLDINDALLAKAKIVAVKERTTLTRLIEQGLVLRLRAPAAASRERPALPVFAGTGGQAKAVTDSLSNRALLDAADDMEGLA